MSVVAPGMGWLFFSHWKVMPMPVALTVKLALPPRPAICETGESWITGGGMTPVPLRLMTKRGLSGSLLAISMLPVCAPCAGGVNSTTRLVCAPGSRVPEGSVCGLKPAPATAAAMPVRLSVSPVLCRVNSIWTVWPTVTAPACTAAPPLARETPLRRTTRFSGSTSTALT